MGELKKITRRTVTWKLPEFYSLCTCTKFCKIFPKIFLTVSEIPSICLEILPKISTNFWKFSQKFSKVIQNFNFSHSKFYLFFFQNFLNKYIYYYNFVKFSSKFLNIFLKSFHNYPPITLLVCFFLLFLKNCIEIILFSKLLKKLSKNIAKIILIWDLFGNQV